MGQAFQPNYIGSGNAALRSGGLIERGSVLTVDLDWKWGLCRHHE